MGSAGQPVGYGQRDMGPVEAQASLGEPAVIVWLWSAGPWRGVCDTLDLARKRTDGCLRRGATSGLVQAAVLRFDSGTLQEGYFPTGRMTTARMVGPDVYWSPLAWALDDVQLAGA